MKWRSTLINLVAVIDLMLISAFAARGEPGVSKDPFVDNGKALEVADLFAWTTPDAEKVNLIATMRVARAVGWRFPKGADIVFHISSSPAYGTPGTDVELLCHFYDFDGVECWLGDAYVAAKVGVPSQGVGPDRRLRVFAGLRDDPAFFDRAALEGVSKGLLESLMPAPPMKDEFGCMAPWPGGYQMAHTLYAPDPKKVVDAHEGRNVLAVVLQVPTVMLQAAGPMLGVWVSAHAP